MPFARHAEYRQHPAVSCQGRCPGFARRGTEVLKQEHKRQEREGSAVSSLVTAQEMARAAFPEHL